MAELDADAAVAHYLDRVPRGRELYERDPELHAHLTWLRAIWPLVDRVLKADGVTAATRERTLNTLIYGNPDPNEAITDLRRLDAVLDHMQTSVLGDLKPGHQFDGILGMLGEERP